MSEKGLAKVERSESYIVGVDDAISPARLIEQVALIQNVMKSVMRDGEHYGKIPGCGDKPTLLKPGAEKLCFTFRMDPEFDIEVIDMGRGHREYRIKCTLFAINGGNRIGSGVGSASTMEGKWRFRTGPVESTEKPVPTEYWDQRKSDPVKAQEAIGGRGFSTKKIDGVWVIVKQGEKVEHDNPADVFNTVLKMAKKRAMVDAVLTCTAASDIFTQDVEELVENEVITVKAEASKPAPQAASQSDEGPATDEDVMRDELYVVCSAIGEIEGMEVSAVLNSLTATAKFKGYTKTTDVPMTATYNNKEWSPLTKTLEKARKKLKEIKEPGSDG